VTGTLSAPALKTHRWLWFADSIGEGLCLVNASGVTADSNAAATAQMQMAASLDAEIGNVSVGSQGWRSRGGIGGTVPDFHDPSNTSLQSWRYLWSSQARSFSGIDAIFVQMGVNDVYTQVSDATVQASVEDFLTDFRAAHPTIDVYIVIPYNQSKSSAILAADTAHGSDSRVHVVDLGAPAQTDLLGTPGTYSVDGIHPNQLDHNRLATMLENAVPGA
jgi:lysophospholipase L1-like esterase